MGKRVRNRLPSNTAPNTASLGEVLDRSAEYLFSHHQAINAGHFDLQQAIVLLGPDFNVPLASLMAKADGAVEDGPYRNFALWGSVDYSKFGTAYFVAQSAFKNGKTQRKLESLEERIDTLESKVKLKEN